MRHVNDGLQPSFQERIGHLVQHDGQKDRCRKCERDLQKGNGQGIPDNLDHLGAFENPGKVRESDPRTLRKSRNGLYSLKASDMPSMGRYRYTIK